MLRPPILDYTIKDGSQHFILPHQPVKMIHQQLYIFQ
jgi:hypothetical protein